MKDNPNQNKKFKMNYAPHFGMFKNNAGDGYIKELNFMAEQGFTAFEDNGMKSRSIADQEKIAAEMIKLNMTMGVFVAHKIYWKEANLTSGKQDYRDEFLKDIRESVEVAKQLLDAMDVHLKMSVKIMKNGKPEGSKRALPNSSFKKRLITRLLQYLVVPFFKSQI